MWAEECADPGRGGGGWVGWERCPAADKETRMRLVRRDCGRLLSAAPAVSLLLAAAACGTAASHVEPGRQAAARPSYYERCVEIGPHAAGEAANLVLEWTLLQDPAFRFQLALHGRSRRGFVGVGFRDVDAGAQVVAGAPHGDLACARATHAPALERDSFGTPYAYGVEVPGQYVESDELWTHVRIDRNISVGATGDPYTDPVRFTVVWGYRHGGLFGGACSDPSAAEPLTEHAHFDLDLGDPSNLYANPAARQKLFTPGEARCAHLAPSLLGGSPVHPREGLLSGERHQSARNVVLLVGGGSTGAGAYGLRSGEAAPLFDAAAGAVLAGEDGNDVCHASRHAVHARWSGFSEPVGGVARYTLTLRGRSGETLLEEADVGLRTQVAHAHGLEANATVRVEVSAHNHAGLKTMRASSWVRVLNGEATLGAAVHAGPDDNGYFAGTQGSPHAGSVLYWPHAAWLDAWFDGYQREDRDALSAAGQWTLRGYYYAVGDAGGGNATSAADWTYVAPSSPDGREVVRRAGLALVDAAAYIVTVRTTNCAQGFSYAASHAFTVDLSPPSPGLVFDGNVTQFSDRTAMRPWEPFHASWAFFEDRTSGLHHYEWAVGTSRHNFTAPSIQGWVSVGLLQAADTLTSFANSSVPDLRSLGVAVGDTVYTYVRAYDKAGHFTTVASNGTVVVLY